MLVEAGQFQEAQQTFQKANVLAKKIGDEDLEEAVRDAIKSLNAQQKAKAGASSGGGKKQEQGQKRKK